MNNKKVFKLRNKKTPKYSYLIIGIIFGCILVLSIGWSALNQNLYISDISLKVEAKKDIRITSLSISKLDNENQGIINNESYDYNKLFSDITLPNKDSLVNFRVEVTNFGNVEMGILKFDNLPSNLEIVLTDYNLEDKICNQDACKLGIKKEFILTIKYKENGFNENNTNYNLNILFDFRSFHKITYSNFLINTNKFPQEVIDGGTLKITFDETIKENNLELYINGIKEIFTWDNNTLTYENVTSDIEISYKSGIIEKNELFTLLENKSLGTDANTNFYDSSNIETGVFMYDESKDDDFPIYYYRGDIVDNNVIYANHCWKIVRTTEYGGIKIVYNGEVQSGNTCTGYHARLGTEPYNGNEAEAASPSEVGYMYGLDINFEEIKPQVKVNFVFGNDVIWDPETKLYSLVNTIVNTDLNQLEDDIRGGSNGNYKNQAFHYTCLSTTNTCSTVYYIYYNNYGEVDEPKTGLYALPINNGMNVTEVLEAMLYGADNNISSLAKGTDSITGDYVDSWFKNKSGINVNDLDDVVWCNDRSIGGYHGWDKDTDNHAYDNKYLHFEGYRRLEEDKERPILFCPNKNDNFTVSDTVRGNGNLTYPVGLLTADEFVLAGAIHNETTSYYLISDSGQWTMTPYYFSDDNARMFRVNSEGQLTESYTYSGNGIRPAIALKPIFKIASGDGTSSNPYTLTK